MASRVRTQKQFQSTIPLNRHNVKYNLRYEEIEVSHAIDKSTVESKFL